MFYKHNLRIRKTKLKEKPKTSSSGKKQRWINREDNSIKHKQKQSKHRRIRYKKHQNVTIIPEITTNEDIQVRRKAGNGTDKKWGVSVGSMPVIQCFYM